MIYKIAILCYVILYTIVALGIRPYILYKNTGINAYKKMGGGEGIQSINERVLILGAMLIPIISMIYLFSEDLYQYLVPISYLEIEWIKRTGILLMLLGSFIVIVAQFQMGDSWRIGINTEEKTSLVKSGLYRYSRNPIYLSLLISFIGFFLILPNALSLCGLTLGYPSLEIKIRLEEKYLISKHGDSYRQYMSDVNRWI